MKITKVRAHILEAKLSQPFAYSCASLQLIVSAQ